MEVWSLVVLSRCVALSLPSRFLDIGTVEPPVQVGALMYIHVFNYVVEEHLAWYPLILDF